MDTENRLFGMMTIFLLVLSTYFAWRSSQKQTVSSTEAAVSIAVMLAIRLAVIFICTSWLRKHYKQLHQVALQPSSPRVKELKWATAINAGILLTLGTCALAVRLLTAAEIVGAYANNDLTTIVLVLGLMDRVVDIMAITWVLATLLLCDPDAEKPMPSQTVFLVCYLLVSLVFSIGLFGSPDLAWEKLPLAGSAPLLIGDNARPFILAVLQPLSGIFLLRAAAMLVVSRPHYAEPVSRAEPSDHNGSGPSLHMLSYVLPYLPLFALALLLVLLQEGPQSTSAPLCLEGYLQLALFLVAVPVLGSGLCEPRRWRFDPALLASAALGVAFFAMRSREGARDPLARVCAVWRGLPFVVDVAETAVSAALFVAVCAGAAYSKPFACFLSALCALLLLWDVGDRFVELQSYDAPLSISQVLYMAAVDLHLRALQSFTRFVLPNAILLAAPDADQLGEPLLKGAPVDNYGATGIKGSRAPVRPGEFQPWPLVPQDRLRRTSKEPALQGAYSDVPSTQHHRAPERPSPPRQPGAPGAIESNASAV